MFEPSERAVRIANEPNLQRKRSERPSGNGLVAQGPFAQGLGSAVDEALQRARAVAGTWRGRAMDGEPRSRWLLEVPDIGPACEVILADQLFHDLTEAEREGLLDFIRGSQDETGAWLSVDGEPDLSLTALGWWARRQAGDDADSESMVRAARVVHALGGIQRANFQVRLWMAMGGQIPWSFLPAIPSELFLLPSSALISPARFSPWARGMLTPYLLIARAPARLQLPDATPLLLQRNDGTMVVPRLTRHGLPGDLLQAFDRTVKLSRKLPRGPMPRWASARAERWIDDEQQAHGGWFSVRPTLLSLVALRVMGASSDDPRIRRGLEYLRQARGLARIPRGRAAGETALCQGVTGLPMATMARLLEADRTPEDITWLLRHELTSAGHWQTRADAPAGGWPLEPRGRQHLDLEATCAVLDVLGRVPADSPQRAAAWSSTRRALDVVLAMQEPSGGFSRFERGESDVYLRRFPWTDADLLAFGEPTDSQHLRLCASALTELGRTGFRLEDDRVARGIAWLQRVSADAWAHRSLQTLGAVARCIGAVCPTSHPLRREFEQRIRGRQREDGSFGDLVETAHAVVGLLELGEPCVQVERAVRYLVRAANNDAPEFQSATAAKCDGLGLSPACHDPSAGAREVARALTVYRLKHR